MKKWISGVIAAALAVTGAAALVACGDETGDGAKEKTVRMEAELATTHESITLSSRDLVSNGYVVYPSGGFTFESKGDALCEFKFTAAKAGSATFTIRVASANTFGNAFELDDSAWCFYVNDVALGKPAADKILDYMGDPTTEIPKEDYVDGTGFVDISWTANLKEGENTFAWKYVGGSQAFNLDYVDVTSKCDITWTPSTREMPSGDEFFFPED